MTSKLLDAVLHNASGGRLLNEDASLSVIHLSPLDTCVELAVLAWSSCLQKVRVLSNTTRIDDHVACDAKLQRTFLDDCRLHQHRFVPESRIKSTDEVDAMTKQRLERALPELTLAQWSQTGDRAILPVSVRQRWVGDPIYGQAWEDEMKAFDKHVGAPATKLVPQHDAQTDGADVGAPEGWRVALATDLLSDLTELKEMAPSAPDAGPRVGVTLKLVSHSDQPLKLHL